MIQLKKELDRKRKILTRKNKGLISSAQADSFFLPCLPGRQKHPARPVKPSLFFCFTGGNPACPVKPVFSLV